MINTIVLNAVNYKYDIKWKISNVELFIVV